MLYHQSHVLHDGTEVCREDNRLSQALCGGREQSSNLTLADYVLQYVEDCSHSFKSLDEIPNTMSDSTIGPQQRYFTFPEHPTQELCAPACPTNGD